MTKSTFKEIKYIGFYDLANSKKKRVAALAATNKMDYICDALNRAGYLVHLISPSWFNESVLNATFQTQRTIQLSKLKRLTLSPSMSSRINITRNIKIIMSLLWLFIWLVVHTRRREKLLAYHSPWLSLPLRLAKNIRGFELILEVEEVYAKVWHIKSILQKWENKILACADSFIAVSEVLAKELGSKAKIIIYGNYSFSDLPEKKWESNLINVVYAGSIDHHKGGAFNAIRCAMYLPHEYIINLCGFGGDEEIGDLRKNIALINESLGREACIYHGIKTGTNFANFLHSCQMGINPQLEGHYMDTAFPSKVLTYISHNLRVVSTRIESLEKSTIASLISFSDNCSPESMAKAIMTIDLNSVHDYKNTIKQLDEEFVLRLRALIEA